MGRQVYRPPKTDTFKPGEGFVELERTMRALSRKEEDVLLKRATREALDKLWRRKGVTGKDTPRSPVSREVRYK